MNSAIYLEYLKSLNFRPDDLVCLSFAGSNSKWENQFREFSSLSTPAIIQMLAYRNERDGENIFISMAPFIPGTKERRKEFVAGVRHVWIDADANRDAVLEQITKDVSAGTLPEPALEVETSPGKAQVIWHVANTDVAAQEQLNQALQLRYKTDDSVTDTARLLRIAGLKNNKYPEKPTASILYVGSQSERDCLDFEIDMPVAFAKTPVPIDSGQPIPQGKRNDALASLAGSLRQKGLTREEIELVLVRINDERCTPPLEIAEVKIIAGSISRYEAGDPISGMVLSRSNIAVESAQAQTDNAERLSHWREHFKTIGQLEEGEPIMLIKNFLIEGVTFIGSLPGESKTWLALSIAKALVTGKNLFGRSDFSVPNVTPVLYLVPESGGRAFKRRCKKMGLPDDEKLFLCRTITEGKMLLSDPFLLEAVRQLKPAVFLDTLIRFNEADSENEAMQNKQLVDDITRLRQAGAIVVVPLHHATKALRTQGLSLDTVLRGTGDISASADCVYGLLRDDSLYQNGQGPNEVDIVCVKPRDLDPPPLPFRFALSRRTPRVAGSTIIGLAPDIESVIDATGDIQICQNTAKREKREIEEQKNRELVELVTTNPTITLDELEKEVEMPASSIRRTLIKLGWSKPRGGAKDSFSWTKKVICLDSPEVS